MTAYGTLTARDHGAERRAILRMTDWARARKFERYGPLHWVIPNDGSWTLTSLDGIEVRRTGMDGELHLIGRKSWRDPQCTLCSLYRDPTGPRVEGLPDDTYSASTPARAHRPLSRSWLTVPVVAGVAAFAATLTGSPLVANTAGTTAQAPNVGDDGTAWDPSTATGPTAGPGELFPGVPAHTPPAGAIHAPAPAAPVAPSQNFVEAYEAGQAAVAEAPAPTGPDVAPEDWGAAYETHRDDVAEAGPPVIDLPDDVEPIYDDSGAAPPVEDAAEPPAPEPETPPAEAPVAEPDVVDLGFTPEPSLPVVDPAPPVVLPEPVTPATPVETVTEDSTGRTTTEAAESLPDPADLREAADYYRLAAEHLDKAAAAIEAGDAVGPGGQGGSADNIGTDSTPPEDGDAGDAAVDVTLPEVEITVNGETQTVSVTLHAVQVNSDTDGVEAA